ncbi:GNAT family N-acetyltransferase [Maricaulis sp.]|uniref:GNAT family N-acetyltransferase n=1 Tax=Maricaulis sp. TaxID=1486257 RepID=UPI0025BA6CEE|nr:GNAT family N-acetyltransferase [Maricaulis sp.]
MPKPIEIVSPRLRLVALNAELAVLQVEDRLGFFRALGVEPEPSWPPELMDKTTLEWTRDQLVSHPADTGWYSWIYISPVMNRLLGTGGFKGAPDAAGAVEIGYSMLLSYREQGLATEGVVALLDWAYTHERVKSVLAHTRDDRDASHRVLEKAGFVQGETRYDPEEGFNVVAWHHAPSRQAA